VDDMIYWIFAGVIAVCLVVCIGAGLRKDL
jgi:hypothetical protein